MDFFLKHLEKKCLKVWKIKKKLNEKKKMERAVKTQKFHSENEFCLQWLKENKVDEILALSWFNIFRFRN